MKPEEEILLLEKCLHLIEQKLMMGDRNRWENRHFEQISEQIFNISGINISGRTLRRLFGKDKTYKEFYNPQLATKNALALYAGYQSWEDFISAHKSKAAPLKKRNVKVPVIAGSIILGFILLITFLVIDTSKLKNNKTELQEIKDPAFKGYYKILAKHSGKCLDVAGELNGDGTSVWQWEYWGGDNQKWKIAEVENGVFVILAKHSNLCLDAGPSASIGSNLQQTLYSQTRYQMWSIQEVEKGFFKISVRNSNICIAVGQNSEVNGIPIMLWRYDGSDTQKWRLEKVM